jgi:hypothetical protein
MALYELSIDAGHVREAEKITSLEGRGYPTLAMGWDTRIFDQPWHTTIVLDYLIALPPLMIGQATFNEVKVAAYVGGAATKFLYFGTEMSSAVPRVAPEMENSLAPPKEYQEFRLEEQTCPLPYLKLIQATPRIYGNGPQDYYSPPIKVERYDGAVTPELVADFFATTVANLETVKGSWLTDSTRGFWSGARFVGVTVIAILRQGKVVGLHRRVGRTDKDPMPPEVKKRDPRLDELREWVGIDIGASTTVVALRGERGPAEIVRIGATSPVTLPSDNETPTELGFENLARTVKAWRDRVILPITRWGDVVVGHAAKQRRSQAGGDQLQRLASTIHAVPLLRERIERHEPYRFRGQTDPETNEMLRKPAPPIIDEDGIGSHDPFDPMELYAYYVGVTINHRHRGVHLRYAITMPTGWTPERRQSVLIAFRRGLYRSLPAGLVEYHDTERLEVLDAGPATIPFSVQAFRTFNIKGENSTVFATIDAGASETGILFGLIRPPKQEERSLGYDRMIEHLEPQSLTWLGGERLLHRVAYRCYERNAAALRDARIPIERPVEEPPFEVGAELLVATPEARANTTTLKDALRPILEGTNVKMPDKARFFNDRGEVVEVLLEIDRDAAQASLEGWLSEGVAAFKQALVTALQKIGRDPDPYDGVRIILGGRMGMHPFFDQELTKSLPSNVQIHRFKEPDKTNLQTPTVKTSVALGVLGLKHDRIGAVARAEMRDAFRYRVGRARHGQLADVLDPTVEYDEWREIGACTKADVEVLFMLAEDDGEVAADDPRVLRGICPLGPSAVGQRLYVRAVGPSRVQVSVGPPGGEPASGAPCFALELKTGKAERV